MQMSIRRHVGWPLIGAIAFCLYAAALLLNGFHSEQQLRSEADARLLIESGRRAAAVGDFFAQLRKDAVAFAESQQIANYNVNKALGMSPRYGLDANIDAIADMFRTKQKQITVRGQAIFDRVTLFDETGAVLADAASYSRPSIRWGPSIRRAKSRCQNRHRTWRPHVPGAGSLSRRSRRIDRRGGADGATGSLSDPVRRRFRLF